MPDWVDRDQVELGAEIWRRWGTMLFSVAGAITLEIYTESGVATPLSLAGGYAGDNALRRFLESAKFWIDTSAPGDLFRPGSPGRTTAMQVRIMHVAVRKRVGEHPEWDHEKWGLPISQTYMMLTQVGGSVAPALALWLLGYQTTPRRCGRSCTSTATWATCSACDRSGCRRRCGTVSRSSRLRRRPGPTTRASTARSSSSPSPGPSHRARDRRG